jgi:glycosyltransferase involved in cell wall biosynthesis
MQSSGKVRLLFVLHSSNLGGAERLHTELVENLVKRQFETISVLPNHDGGLAEMIKSSGGQVRQIDSMEWWTDANFKLSIDELADHPSTQSIIEIITSEKIDLVVTHTGVIPYGALAATVSGVPHIWYLHEFIDKDHGMKIPFGREQFSSFIDKHSHQIWSNSKAIANYFFSTKSKKTRVVFNIPQVDITKLSSLEKSNKRQIGVIGNFDGGKNIETVIRSCGLLSLKTTDFKLNIFGWGSEVKVHELTSLVKSLGISDNVFFQGVKSDLYEMYDQIDVLVMASKN